MGLFDWFRRRKKPAVPMEQLCYDVAYFVLPHYAFNDLTKVAELCVNAPTAAGPFFYLMACQMRNVKPDFEAAKQFQWTHGDFDATRKYYALEYPDPSPIDLSEMSLEQVARGRRLIALAPYFSAIVHDRPTDKVNYFVLGQAPMGGGSTFRQVTSDGKNCNLGPGPQPERSAFLAAIRQYLSNST